jgi:hypothetical protein
VEASLVRLVLLVLLTKLKIARMGKKVVIVGNKVDLLNQSHKSKVRMKVADQHL